MYNISVSFNYFCQKSIVMKKTILILLFCFSFSSNGQVLCSINDTNFEQSLIDLGYDVILDGFVFTVNIDTVTSLDVSFQDIYDLSGIECFTSLEHLDCSNNDLISLDLNQNASLRNLNCSSNNITSLVIDNLTNLDVLDCSFNSLSFLNLSQNVELDSLQCSNNQLNTLEVNTNLGYLYCGGNYLTSLDFSSLIFNGLYELRCENNLITYINLKNNSNLKHLTCHNNLLTTIDLSDNYNLEWLSIGNNTIFTNNNNLLSLDLSANCNITNLYSKGNLNLYCIQVCDMVQTSSWITDIGTQQYFSLNCNYTSVNDVLNTNVKLIETYDLLGRKNFKSENSFLFLIFDDGRIKKQFFINK